MMLQRLIEDAGEGEVLPGSAVHDDSLRIDLCSQECKQYKMREKQRELIGFGR